MRSEYKGTAGIFSPTNPKGAGRVPGKGRRGTRRWQPSVWKPLYDQIIALRLADKKVTFIAETLHLSVGQVNNILNCDEGLRIRGEAIKKLRGLLLGTVDDRMHTIVDATISRTHQLITNDEIFAKAPITAIKTAIALGRATGHFKGDTSESGSGNSNHGSTVINNNTLNVIGEGGVDIIKRAMAGSDEARRLNPGLGIEQQIGIVPAPVQIKKDG